MRIGDLVERLFNPPNGLFLRVGGLPQGAGLPLGPGYRLSNDKASVFGYGVLAPLSGYWDVGTELSFNHLFNHHAFIVAGARHMDLPQEDFFGIGIDSTEATEDVLRAETVGVHVRGGNTPGDLFQLVGASPTRRHGSARARIRAFRLLRTGVHAGAGARIVPGHRFSPDRRCAHRRCIGFPARSTVGGLYTFAFEKFSDRKLNRFSFSQWSVDLRQFVPIVRGFPQHRRAVFATARRRTTATRCRTTTCRRLAARTWCADWPTTGSAIETWRSRTSSTGTSSTRS